MEKYRSRHPELKDEDEDGFYGSLEGDFDNFDNEINELRASNDKYKKDQDDFLRALASNKDNARYLEGMMNGEDQLETAIGIHGYDGLLDYLQSEEAREKYKKADEKHKEELAKNEELERECMANAEQTEKDLQKAITEGRFTKEEYQSALEELFNIADGLELNVCKPEWIEMVIAAKNRDRDVEQAREDGRKAGKNEGLEQNINSKKGARNADKKQTMPVGLGGRVGTEPKKGGQTLAEMLMSK
jgi:hypothetical protein